MLILLFRAEQMLKQGIPHRLWLPCHCQVATGCLGFSVRAHHDMFFSSILLSKFCHLWLKKKKKSRWQQTEYQTQSSASAVAQVETLRWRVQGGVEASGKAQRLYQHWRSWGEAMLNGKVSKNTQRDWSSSAPCRGVKKKKKIWQWVERST